jgi:hypothetical protein
LPDDKIEINFSQDNGKNWQTLSNYSTGFDFDWNNIPDIDSDECLLELVNLGEDGSRDLSPKLNWIKTFGGSNIDEINSITISPKGNYVVAGHSGSVDGIPEKNNGSTDLWIAEIDTSGKILWSKIYGGSGSDYGMKIISAGTEGYLVVSDTRSTDGDVRSGQGKNGSHDFWALKIGLKGELIWENSFGGNNDEFLTDAVATYDGGFALFGRSNSSDNSSVNKGVYDYWLVKINKDGFLQWENSYGGTKSEYPGELIATDDGGYILSGYSGSTNGDKTETFGFDDVWLVKNR